MNHYPETSASLIAGIQDPGNADAWADFERIYRPTIFRVARAKGLQYADALDLVQQVLISVASAIPQYESRENGPPFRNWLSRITRNATLQALTRGPRDRAAGGTGLLELISEVASPEAETDAMIQLEHRREVFRIAAERIRGEVQPATWLAFELTVIQGQSIESASERLNLSIGNVYAARSRTMKRLKEAVRQIEFAEIQ